MNFDPATYDVEPVCYRHGSKIHLNPLNQPNCIFRTIEDENGNNLVIPVFCTPLYGITDFKTSPVTDVHFQETAAFSTDIPDPSERSQGKACYWTPETFILYLHWHTRQALKVYSLYNFPQYATVPECIIWPLSVSSALNDFTLQSRKAFERVFHCHSLLHILNDLCQAAGPFALNMLSNEDGTNNLEIVRTRYLGADGVNTPSQSGDKGIRLDRAIGGAAGDDMTTPTVNGGFITETSDNLMHVVEPVGDHAYIECRCASPDTNGDVEAHYVPLELAFSAKQLEQARALLEQGFNAGVPDKDLLTAVFRTYDVCATWRSKPGFDFQVGTQQAGFDVGAVSRVPLPHLLPVL